MVCHCVIYLRIVIRKSNQFLPSSFQVSITFDPFLYLPVPLPQKQKVLTVFYFAKEPHKKPVKVKLSKYFLLITFHFILLYLLC